VSQQTVHHVPHLVTVPGRADHSSLSVRVHIPANDDSSAGDNVLNWASAPALRSDPDPAAENSSTLSPPCGQAFNRSSGSSHSIVDLIKAYSKGKGKFSDKDLLCVTVECNTHTCPVHSIALLSSEMELNNS
jgi:hypothetical protein